MSTRAARKAETRVLLRDTARDLFARDGFEGTSIGAITSAAGVAHGTFYVHFASKDALLDELLAEFNEGLARRFAPLWMRAEGPLRERVEATSRLFLDTWREHQGFVEVYAQHAAAGLRVDQLRDGINPPAAQLLTAALVQLGRVRPIPEPELIAHGLLAAWLRIGLQHLFGGVDRDRAVAALVHLTLGALGPAETP